MLHVQQELKKDLNKIEGVTLANVNLALENATVEYNPSQISVADIIATSRKIRVWGASIKRMKRSS